MGAAMVAGAMAACGFRLQLPKAIHSIALIVVSSGVGLTITPEVGASLLAFAPLMFVVAFLGIAFAVLLTPFFAKTARLLNSS